MQSSLNFKNTSLINKNIKRIDKLIFYAHNGIKITKFFCFILYFFQAAYGLGIVYRIVISSKLRCLCQYQPKLTTDPWPSGSIVMSTLQITVVFCCWPFNAVGFGDETAAIKSKIRCRPRGSNPSLSDCRDDRSYFKHTLYPLQHSELQVL